MAGVLRSLLLVFLFVIWETPVPAEVRPPVVPGVGVFFGGYALVVGAMTLWGMRAADERRGGDVDRRADRFLFWLEVARFAVIGWFAAGVYGLGWRGAVEHLLGPVGHWPRGRDPVVLPGTALGVLPGLLAWAGLWPAQYPVERAMVERNVLPQMEADLPVFAPPTFGQFMANRLRVQLLFTVVPLGMILVLRDAATAAFAALPPAPAVVETGTYLAAAAAVLLLAPVVLRHVLWTTPLPASRLRVGLDAVGRQAGVRCREILLWRTHHHLGNAAVMGLVRPVRYVLLSDLLLASMTDEQVQAVYAHELGHVRHRHLVWMVGVIGCGAAALDRVEELLDGYLRLGTAGEVAFQVGAGVVTIGLFGLGFGLLSRWFERQADVYASRLMDRATAESAAAPLGEGVGAGLFASALLRVAVVNNIPVAAPNWTHGSIAQRVRYVRRFADDPATAARFDRTGRRVRAGLVVGMVLCAAVAGSSLVRPQAGRLPTAKREQSRAVSARAVDGTPSSAPLGRHA